MTQPDKPSLPPAWARSAKRWQRLRPSTTVLLASADSLCWTASTAAAGLVLSDVDARPSAFFLGVAAFVAVVFQLGAGVVLGLYRGRFPVGSLPEVKTLALTALLSAVGLFACVTFAWWMVGGLMSPPRGMVPHSLLLATAPLALLLMIGLRAVPRMARDQKLTHGHGSRPTLIFGAGQIGEQLARRMLSEIDSGYRPVGFLDDAPSKARQRILSLPVLGTRDEIRSVVTATGATTLVIAVTSLDEEVTRALSLTAREAGLRVVVLPPLEALLRGADALTDLRDVSIEDIVGRSPVSFEAGINASYIRGRRVLVTGAGGSIGSELCRQISALAPGELIMLDRDETALQQVQLAISGHGLLDTPDVVLGDIRDGPALTALFLDRRPDVVFHAAALKHLPMLEQYPLEAWKTNVLGTLNVLDAASAAGVSTFVNVSTDKAANPISVLGASKRLAERLTADFARRERGRYLSVRFGNVLGSRGSLVPVFRTLIQAGEPLTVTHAEATRYFMTIPEACHLVLQAGAIGSPAEVLILDMGEPVKIVDIAEKMIALSGRDIGIVFTGLRPGEKLHEELIGEGECDERPVHPKISHAAVPAIAACDLDVDTFVDDIRRYRHDDIARQPVR